MQKMSLQEALDLYQKGEISSGAGAQLTGFSRAQFVQRAILWGIPTFQVNDSDGPLTDKEREAVVYEVVLGIDTEDVSNVLYCGEDFKIAQQMVRAGKDEFPVRVYAVTTRFNDKGYWDEISRQEMALET